MHGYCSKCVNIHSFRETDVEDFWGKMCKIGWFLHFAKFYTSTDVDALSMLTKTNTNVHVKFFQSSSGCLKFKILLAVFFTLSDVIFQ